MTRPGLATCVLLLSAWGCSKQPPTRFDLSGTVTFDGRPVPAGLITITADLSKGNDGPQGVAEIHDGRFDTRSLDKGAPSGPVILLIDGVGADGKPLFSGYKLSLELPKEATHRDIEVPKAAGAHKKPATP